MDKLDAFMVAARLAAPHLTGRPTNVIWRKRLSDPYVRYGLCYNKDGVCVIELEDGMSVAQAYKTFLHEAGHGRCKHSRAFVDAAKRPPSTWHGPRLWQRDPAKYDANEIDAEAFAESWEAWADYVAGWEGDYTDKLLALLDWRPQR